MKKYTDNRKNRTVLIVSLCILLVIGIAVTVALLGDRLKDVAPSDSDVIELVLSGNEAENLPLVSSTDGDTEEEDADRGESAGDTEASENAGESGAAESAGHVGYAGSAVPSVSAVIAASSDDAVGAPSGSGGGGSSHRSGSYPGFEAEDGRQVWTSDTWVDIFRISYDEHGEVTVNSDDGDKVLAPGTDSSYTFKFKNNGDVALDYSMSVAAYITPGEISLPIQAKMNRYDGTWLVGSDEDWEPVLQLNGVTDSATLGVNRYAYYTLDWQWPYETADAAGDVTQGDIYDTWLGDLAVGEDITLTVEIRVTATADTDSGTGSGTGSGGASVIDLITVGRTQTGDDSQILLYVLLALASGILLILLLLRRRRIYVTGFISGGEPYTVDVDGELYEFTSDDRFVAEEMTYGKHRITLQDRQGRELAACEVKLVRKNGVDGLRFTEDGRMQTLLTGRKTIAVELHLEQCGSRMTVCTSRWATIDKKHFVYTQDGENAPEDGCNVTPDGLSIDRDGHLEVRMKTSGTANE